MSSPAATPARYGLDLYLDLYLDQDSLSLHHGVHVVSSGYGGLEINRGVCGLAERPGSTLRQEDDEHSARSGVRCRSRVR